MKKTKFSLLIGGLTIATALVVVSCVKKPTTTTTPAQDTSTTSATDNNTAESSSKDMMNIGSEAIDNGHLTTYRLAEGQGNGGVISPMSGTVTVNVDSLSSKKLTVTFSTGFIGFDGIARSGTIKYDWSNSTPSAVYFKDAGFDVIVSTPFNDYVVNTNTVTIVTKEVKNLGAVTNGCYTWSDVANIKIVKPSNGGTITWNYTGDMILLNTVGIMYAGSQVPAVYPTSSGGFIDWIHAVIGFTGNASGTSASGTSYTANITSRVEYNFNCAPYYPANPYLQWYHPPVAGSIDFTPQGVTTRTINYGTGTCDDSYTITIGTWSGTFNFI